MGKFLHGLFPEVADDDRRTFLLAFGLLIGIFIRLLIPYFIEYSIDHGDAAYYHATALNILQYFTYSEDVDPTAFRPPLYSGFLAMVLALNDELVLIQIVQLILSLVSGLVVTRICALTIPRVAPIVFLLFMVSPYEAVYVGAVLSECLMTLLLLLLVLCAHEFSGTRRWFSMGILAGLSSLNRDIYILLPFFFAAAFFLLAKGEDKLRMVYGTVLMVAAMAVVIAPWTARNYIVLDKFVPISEGRLGLTLWLGSWAVSARELEYSKDHELIAPSRVLDDTLGIDLVNRASRGKVSEEEYLQLFKARIQSEPLQVFETYIRRAPLLWVGTRFDVFEFDSRWLPRDSRQWILVKILLWGLNSLLVTLALIGMWLAFRMKLPLLVLSMPILYTASVYLPLPGFENRYSQPVYPLLLVFVSISLDQGYRYLTRWKANRIQTFNE
ncbi:MAG: hypothetical protein ABGY96_03475 [bacterium]|nr:hypothetical protein [Gammaproteobacteria bacterium]